MIIIIIKVIGLMYTFAFDCYERAVRTEDVRKDVDILKCYVSLGLNYAREQETVKQSRYVYWRIMNTLEETLCDSLLSFYWRRQVYNSIKQFKPIMYEVLSEKQYEAFNYRLKLHADYFLDLDDSIAVSPIDTSDLTMKNVNTIKR